MRGVRFTKAELAFLRNVLGVMKEPGTVWDWSCFGTKVKEHATSLLAKLDAAETVPAGVAVKPIEDALIKSSHGKVLALEGGHAVASRRLTQMKVTAEDAELVGAYMARQQWLTSPMTLLDVLNKWYQWLPKARATQPPPSLAPGLGGDGTGQGPAPAGKATTGRRPAPGFR